MRPVAGELRPANEIDDARWVPARRGRASVAHRTSATASVLALPAAGLSGAAAGRAARARAPRAGRRGRPRAGPRAAAGPRAGSRSRPAAPGRARGRRRSGGDLLGRLLAEQPQRLAKLLLAERPADELLRRARGAADGERRLRQRRDHVLEGGGGLAAERGDLALRRRVGSGHARAEAQRPEVDRAQPGGPGLDACRRRSGPSRRRHRRPRPRPPGSARASAPSKASRASSSRERTRTGTPAARERSGRADRRCAPAGPARRRRRRERSTARARDVGEAAQALGRLGELGGRDRAVALDVGAEADRALAVGDADEPVPRRGRRPGAGSCSTPRPRWRRSSARAFFPRPRPTGGVFPVKKW